MAQSSPGVDPNTGATYGNWSDFLGDYVGDDPRDYRHVGIGIDSWNNGVNPADHLK